MRALQLSEAGRQPGGTHLAWVLFQAAGHKPHSLLSSLSPHSSSKHPPQTAAQGPLLCANPGTSCWPLPGSHLPLTDVPQAPSETSERQGEAAGRDPKKGKNSSIGWQVPASEAFLRLGPLSLGPHHDQLHLSVPRWDTRTTDLLAQSGRSGSRAWAGSPTHQGQGPYPPALWPRSPRGREQQP